jgi:hypothetical protein
MHDDDERDDAPAEIPTDAPVPVAVSWWCASLGNTLLWARLVVFDSGIAEVLAPSGELSRYDDETSARMDLLDAEYVAFDGLDEADAAAMGFDLDSTEPPSADSDEELLPRMSHKIARGIG